MVLITKHDGASEMKMKIYDPLLFLILSITLLTNFAIYERLNVTREPQNELVLREFKLRSGLSELIEMRRAHAERVDSWNADRRADALEEIQNSEGNL